MIVCCGACRKKYQIDNSKILKDHILFNCHNCQYPIKVIKPKQEINTFNMDNTDFTAAIKLEKRKIIGMSLKQKLLLIFIVIFIFIGSIFTLTYLKIVPSLMHDQINLRTYSISRSLSASLLQPLLLKNYLLINKAAEIYAQLPGVAYVSVLNQNGFVVAGIFGNKKRFTPEFMQKVLNSGFPDEMSYLNRVPNGSDESSLDYTIDGQKIHDVAVKIADTGGETHVGLFTADIDHAVYNSLLPMLIFWVLTAFVGCLSFLYVAQTISIPIWSLAEAAEKISLGEIDLPIRIKGSGEIRALADALERMRISVKSAIVRIRRLSKNRT